MCIMQDPPTSGRAMARAQSTLQLAIPSEFTCSARVTLLGYRIVEVANLALRLSRATNTAVVSPTLYHVLTRRLAPAPEVGKR